MADIRCSLTAAHVISEQLHFYSGAWDSATTWVVVTSTVNSSSLTLPLLGREMLANQEPVAIRKRGEVPR